MLAVATAFGVVIVIQRIVLVTRDGTLGPGPSTIGRRALTPSVPQRDDRVALWTATAGALLFAALGAGSASAQQGTTEAHYFRRRRGPDPLVAPVLPRASLLSIGQRSRTTSQRRKEPE